MSSDYLQARRFAVAPMHAYTNRHARFFYRLLSQRALLYTEMIHARAAIGRHADRELDFDPREQPLAAQLAGNEIASLVEAAVECERRGYSAVNLNIGCPSDKVRHGAFGACLMLQAELVARQIAALAARLRIPVSVKCRLGVDDQNYHRTLPDFLKRLADVGCSEVIIHARKAMLQRLSPRQNRDIPPLDYPFVYAMRERFCNMHISINGGITDISQAQQHLAYVDGVMLGRTVLQSPMLLAQVDSEIFGEAQRRVDLMTLLQQEYASYASVQQAAGVAAPPLLRPFINLFKGWPGGGKFRRVLSTAHASQLPLGDVLAQALDCITQAQNVSFNGKSNQSHKYLLS